MKLRILIAGLVLSTAAQATPTVFYERIARSFVDPIPGGQPGEAFFNLSSPSLSGFDVAFVATGTMGSRGAYCYCGGVMQKIAAGGDPTPREGETFVTFESLAEVHHGEIVFTASTETFAIGIYRWHEGTLSVVADPLTPIPGGEPGETFPEDMLAQPSIDESGVTFFSNGETTEGIYRQREAGDLLEVVADIHTENPWVPGETFTGFETHPYSRNGTTVFGAGSPSFGGVIRDSGGGWVQAFLGGPLPGGEPGETFVLNTPNGRLSAGFESAVFPARGDMGSGGWYRERAGVVEIGVDDDTINPLTGTPFEALGARAAADGERLAFRGRSSGPWALFLKEPDGALVPIAVEGEELEGELVDWAHIHQGSISGPRLGFRVFSNAREAIYVATVGGGPSVVEIPTLTRSALMVLALLVSLAGVALLRR